MVRYRIKTDMFNYFQFDEIIYPHNNGQQWGTKYALAGNNCIPLEVIEALPNYFEKLDEIIVLPEELERFVAVYKQAKLKRLIEE